MEWFNYYGLAIIAIMQIPNILYAIRHRNDVSDIPVKKAIVVVEQKGRYACIVLMIFNIPHTYLNFWFEHALTVYLAVNGALCLAYLIFWAVCWNKSGRCKALSLSVIPSCIFLFSGILLANFPLIAFAVMFAASHIYISCKSLSAEEHNGIL